MSRQPMQALSRSRAYPGRSRLPPGVIEAEARWQRLERHAAKMRSRPANRWRVAALARWERWRAARKIPMSA